MQKNFVVITADVVDSKKYNTNNSNPIISIENTKQSLDEKLVCLNNRIREMGINTLTPFKSSRGDEVQVVSENLENIPVLIRYLRFYCLPLKLRIGIGIGGINYLYDAIYNDSLLYAELAADLIVNPSQDNNKPEKIKKSLLDGYDLNNPEDWNSFIKKYYYLLNPWDMNGKAFYNARKALDLIKDKKGTATSICVDHNMWEIAVQTIFSFIDQNFHKWSESKWKSVQMYDEYGTYEKASKVLDISLQAVQKNCDRANWDVIKNAELNLSRIFQYLSSSLVE